MEDGERIVCEREIGTEKRVCPRSLRLLSWVVWVPERESVCECAGGQKRIGRVVSWQRQGGGGRERENCEWVRVRELGFAATPVVAENDLSQPNTGAY
jgi:hypothetical protein